MENLVPDIKQEQDPPPQLDEVMEVNCDPGMDANLDVINPDMVVNNQSDVYVNDLGSNEFIRPRGLRYVSIIVCKSCNYLSAKPLANNSSDEIVRHLLEVIHETRCIL